MAAKQEREVFVTPKAAAMWPFVTRPSTTFNPEGVYKVTLVLDPSDEEHKKFLGSLKLLVEDAKTQLKQKVVHPPWKPQKNEEGINTGLYEVTFKSSFAPRVFDAVGNKINGDLNVGNGSVVRVSYRPNIYKGMGGGVNLYFQGIQIIDLVEYSGGDADDFGFEPTEGFNVESKYEQLEQARAAVDGESEFSGQENPNPIPDDEIPF